ncbi:MAG TPA: hypothetical protein PLP50_15850 [Thermoanaerobaculia bacterium]|nr:hypothetical protein [Thermoanaerobaculia bacterium]HQN07250.1 hypothetical protein [Thermoanaerobaculia bacterium]HQP88545.1 hypothetical protein [Thermoanaerobaculia bacterium]
MTKARIAGGVVAAALVVLAVAFVVRPRAGEPPAAHDDGLPRPAVVGAGTAAPGEIHPGFLYGRVTTLGGDTYEGRLRWGGAQEAFWGDYFNGRKEANPWLAHVPPDRLPKERRGLSLFGIELGGRRREDDYVRLFMARFGDVARIEARGGDVRVTLRSGAAFDLNRFDASDFDDGVRVWDARRGEVDLDSARIRSVELLPAGPSAAVPSRLFGTVRSRSGEFTGFIQWDREECVGSDTLDGRSDAGEVRLRFDAIRSIARGEPVGSLVTLADGGEVALSGTNDVSDGNRGVYVDDLRYGRVLVSWEVFERVDFREGGEGPGYGDFPPGGPLSGSVTTRDGRRLAGRLVYDLDESETTETLDAPAAGIDYTIPFGLVASVEPAGEGATPARVTLRSGEELKLERKGDLGARNAGLLVFVEGAAGPEYVSWKEVARIDFDGPKAFYPPIVSRHDR